MAHVIVGLSGGVDSAAAAWILLRQGHRITGVTLRTWDTGDSRCCRIDAARETARVLGIPYHVLNCAADFRSKVEEPFRASYLQGTTPNPCVICNPLIKWDWMLYAADILRADLIATGHYASAMRSGKGPCFIRQGRDAAKDQSYMLYRLTQKQISRTMFPLGDLTKTEVRQIAEDAGLPSAGMPDSQEICFVTQGRYDDYIIRQTREMPESGDFVDCEGHVLGRHRGIFRYTVGQRRGLGLALGYPVYVSRICAEQNAIVLAPAGDLLKTEIFCEDAVFGDKDGLHEGERFRASVKIRYRDKGTDAWIEGCEDHQVRIRFDKPVRAPAPGQSAVFYSPDRCVIGGGIIRG